MQPGGPRFRALVAVRVDDAVIGVLSVVVLVWIELVRLDSFCRWCTAVHVCALALLATFLWATTA